MRRRRSSPSTAVRRCRSPAEAAATADVVVSMLADGDVLTEAYTGPDGVLETLRARRRRCRHGHLGTGRRRRGASPGGRRRRRPGRRPGVGEHAGGGGGDAADHGGRRGRGGGQGDAAPRGAGQPDPRRTAGSRSNPEAGGELAAARPQPGAGRGGGPGGGCRGGAGNLARRHRRWGRRCPDGRLPASAVPRSRRLPRSASPSRWRRRISASPSSRLPPAGSP